MKEHITTLEKDIVPKCHNCMFCRPWPEINMNIPLRHQNFAPFCDLLHLVVGLDGLCDKWSLSYEVQNFVVAERLKRIRQGMP